MKPANHFVFGLLPTTVVAGVFSLGCITSGLSAGSPKKPNVLLITTDQQRVDVMSAVGNPWVNTPNMDAIAAQGVYFTRSYCSFPLCSPSRAALHTGRTPHEIRVDRNNVPIDPSMSISGQVFRAAGYDTGYAGKWHLPQTYPADGIAGYEVLNKTTRQGKLAHDVDEATMSAALEFLKRKRDRPFLLVVSFINPHDICLPAGGSPLLPEVWQKYEPKAGTKVPPMPANFALPKAMPESLSRSRHPTWTQSHWEKYRYAYYRMIEDVDQQIGQVLAALRQTGQEENTLIIFTSDHGEGLASHGWTGKMMYFDEEAAVPLIVTWKGVTPAGRIDREHLVSTLDVFPTICDYAGVKPPPSMRGASLRSVMEHPDQPGHEFVVSEMGGGALRAGRSFMIRTREFKYMLFPGVGGAELLFNMQADPGEMKNLAGDATLASELERHRQLLAQWKKVTEEDKYPLQPIPQGASKKGRKQK